MNEPCSPFEPNIPRGPTESTIGTKITDTKVEAEGTKTGTLNATEDLKSAARATVDAYRAKAEQALGDARERARSFQKEIEQEVREKPTKAVFTVLGIGFLLGLILRRR